MRISNPVSPVSRRQEPLAPENAGHSGRFDTAAKPANTASGRMALYDVSAADATKTFVEDDAIS